MSACLYPDSMPHRRAGRHALAAQTEMPFRAFSRQVFAAGALPAGTKPLTAVAVAHVTQRPYCIRGHMKAALRHGANRAQIMEAIWVGAAMCLGATYAHSLLACASLEELPDPDGGA